MVSKSYVSNHSLHKHYYGQGMARFKALVCSVEKVWVVSSKGWPFLSCQKGKNCSTTYAESCQGYRRELVGQLLDGSAMAPMPRPRKKDIKKKITTKKTISVKKPKQDTSDIFSFSTKK